MRTRSSRCSWYRGHDGEPPDELRDQPVAEEILGHHVRQQLDASEVVLRADVRSEADGVLADPLADDLLEARERAATNEENVGRVDRETRCGVAPALRRHGGHRPSRILRSACCTPSPDTSRVIDGLSALRATLSTSSM